MLRHKQDTHTQILITTISITMQLCSNTLRTIETTNRLQSVNPHICLVSQFSSNHTQSLINCTTTRIKPSFNNMHHNIIDSSRRRPTKIGFGLSINLNTDDLINRNVVREERGAATRSITPLE